MTTETLSGLLIERASGSPAAAAVIDDNRTISYLELEQQSAARAAWLVERGVNKGHRVALLMPNGVDWVVNACAIMRIGAVLVPLSTLLRPVELQEQLAVAGVRHLIACRAFRGRDYGEDIGSIDRLALPSLQTLWWHSELGDTADKANCEVAAALAESVVPANDMVIIFTSGSSGAPKGVIHTHGGALRANASGLADRCIKAGERLYLPMPFFWVGGFAGGLISALNAGATLLTEAIPEPAKTLAFLETHRATLFRGWPDQAAQIASSPDYNAERLTSLKPGSLDALLPTGLRANSDCRANLFGMTESFGPYCSYPLDQVLPAGKKGSCGKPLAGIELRIVAPDTGEPLPVGKVGVIQLRGKNMLRGICGKEREEIFTIDGWYSGGDLGWLDEDGFLFYSGRLDDMLKINGVSVYPSEIVKVLETLPQISRAVVTAVPSMSVDDTPLLGAAIVPEGGGHFELETLQRSCAELLSAYKLPKVWKVLASVDELPTLGSGKIDRAALKTLLQGGLQ